MDVVFSNDQFMVIDDFLAPEQAEQLWRWFQIVPFMPNDFRGLTGAWRLDDGRIMRGPDVFYGTIAQELAKHTPGTVAYPTSSAIDLLIEAFARQQATWEHLIGREGAVWRTLAASSRLSERNSSLYWHRDTPADVAGSCSYYAHPEWNVQWGGELFIAHPSALEVPESHGPSMRAPVEVMGQGSVQLPGHLDNREVNEALMKAGMGHYVMPKPNRLVVIRTGNPHMVSKIHPAAGDHVRASVTMFLVRPGREGVGGRR